MTQLPCFSVTSVLSGRQIPGQEKVVCSGVGGVVTWPGEGSMWRCRTYLPGQKKVVCGGVGAVVTWPGEGSMWRCGCRSPSGAASPPPPAAPPQSSPPSPPQPPRLACPCGTWQPIFMRLFGQEHLSIFSYEGSWVPSQPVGRIFFSSTNNWQLPLQDKKSPLLGSPAGKIGKYRIKYTIQN